MKKWKQLMENLKSECAEASPEKKQELDLVVGFAKNLFLIVVFLLAILLVPDDWKLLPMVAVSICFAVTCVDASEYNKIVGKKDQSDDTDGSVVQEDEADDS